MRNNKNLVFGVLALLVAVSAITLAYAGFTQTLNVTGSGKVISSKWDIHFENLSAPTLTKTARVTTAPTIQSGTTIGNYAVTLMTPGDSVSYTFDVVNAGNFDAKITTLTKGTPTCSGSNTNVCNNLTYTLVYTTDNSVVKQNDTLLVGETKTMKLTLTFRDSNSTSVLPTSDVTVTNLGITLLYSQESLYTEIPETPLNNYVYTISASAYNIGGAAPNLTAQVINKNSNNNIIKLSPPEEGPAETAVVSTEEEILSIIASKGYRAFIRHTVVDGNITESDVGFKYTDNNVYYLKGYDTSAYSENASLLNTLCGATAKGSGNDEYYECPGSISAYANAKGRVYSGDGGWDCFVDSGGSTFCARS